MNNITKQVLVYLPWVLLSYIIAFIYMTLITGQIWGNATGIDVLLERFYFFGILPVVLVVGSLIGITFVLTDIYYIKKKLTALPKRAMIRFSFLLLITILVFFCHNFIEKVVDII